VAEHTVCAGGKLVEGELPEFYKEAIRGFDLPISEEAKLSLCHEIIKSLRNEWQSRTKKRRAAKPEAEREQHAAD
jgi:hypothetical protein